MHRIITMKMCILVNRYSLKWLLAEYKALLIESDIWQGCIMIHFGCQFEILFMGKKTLFFAVRLHSFCSVFFLSQRPFCKWSIEEISCSHGCVFKALFKSTRAGHSKKSWNYSVKGWPCCDSLLSECSVCVRWQTDNPGNWSIMDRYSMGNGKTSFPNATKVACLSCWLTLPLFMRWNLCRFRLQIPWT